MKVCKYDPIYHQDIKNVIKSFYDNYLTDYYMSYDEEYVENTIQSYNGENLFLLVKDNACVGILCGISVDSKLGKDRFFHEIFWHVIKPYGRYAFYLLREVKIMLKSFGYTHIIMSVVENGKAEKIKSIYERLGFKPMETHYVRNL